MQNYYNTNNEAGIVLASSKGKAKRQQDFILDFFKRNPDKSFTPFEVLKYCYTNNQQYSVFEVPITSVRRAITNLTENGDLEKTGLMKQCVYGKMVHTWKIKNN
jgi:hypothetical protein